MADETETGAPAETNEAPAEGPVSKKQRAPRRSKVEIEAAAAANSRKVRQKRSGGATPSSAGTTAQAVAKGTVAKGTTNAKLASSTPVSSPPMTASEEMADLLQLEEENKKLRQTLAEKLRAENADLRKRLGV